MFAFTRRQPFKHLVWMLQKLRLGQLGNIKSRLWKPRCCRIDWRREKKTKTFRLAELTGGHISVTACPLVDGSLFIFRLLMDRPQVKGSSQKPDAEPAAQNRCTTHLNFNFLLCNRVLPRWLISLHPLLKRLHKGWCVCGSAALEPRVGTHGGDDRASWSEFSIIEAFLFFFLIFRFQNSEFRPPADALWNTRLEVSPILCRPRWLTNHFVPLLQKKPIKEALACVLHRRTKPLRLCNNSSKRGSQPGSKLKKKILVAY